MKIQEKLSLFLNLIEMPTHSVSKNQLQKINLLARKNINKCLFEDGSSIESDVLTTTRNCFIGANSYMNPGGYIRDHVFIGRYTSIGRRVTIAAGMHSILGLSSSPAILGFGATSYHVDTLKSFGYRRRKLQTIISNDVWIGDGATIMPGITIHTGAVIGANAVITKDVPPYAIIGGIPAKQIRFRFEESIIDKLLASEWWEYDLDQLNKLPTSNIFEFIERLDELKNSLMPDMPTYIIND